MTQQRTSFKRGSDLVISDANIYLYIFVLDVILAGTSGTLNNICLMILCTIWHEKVNSGSFHTIEKIVNHKFVFEDFKRKFVVEYSYSVVWETKIFGIFSLLWYYENWLE